MQSLVKLAKPQSLEPKKRKPETYNPKALNPKTKVDAKPKTPKATKPSSRKIHMGAGFGGLGLKVKFKGR